MNTGVTEARGLNVLIGDSVPMHRLRATIAKVAPSSIAILIQGPTGSGKELVARAIHDLSGRRGRFVAFNVCALTDTMFEDSLFGHVRGAYTGAALTRKGYLCEADGGTLFLDEVGGLSLGPQAKLLRALETKEYRPLGAEGDRRSDFRLVSASNVELSRLVSSGAFRPDLQYRLGAFVLAVPALHERPEDIPALIRHFAIQTSERQRVGWPGLTDGAERYLMDYEWPGNVRQLQHVVESLVLLASGRRVSCHDLSIVLREVPTSVAKDGRNDFMARRLLRVLENHNWKVPAAARELGVDVTTVYRRLRRLGVRDLGAIASAREGRDASSSVANNGTTALPDDAMNRHKAPGPRD